MYDSCAVAYLLKPELFEVAHSYVDVELDGALTKGTTVVDLKGKMNKTPNVNVCVDIDAKEFKKNGLWKAFKNVIKH